MYMLTSYLRPQKEKLLNSVLDRYADRTGQLTVQSHKSVLMTPLGQIPGVTRKPTLLIDDCDFVTEISEAPAGNRDISRFRGKTFYGGWLRSSWGHFLVNSLGRLWALFTATGVVDSVDRIIFFAEDPGACVLRGNFAAFFDILGMTRSIEIIAAPAVFDEIVVPEIALEIGCFTSQEFLLPFAAARNAVMKSVAHATFPASRPVLLSRSHWNGNSRMQINIKLIDNIFRQNGFQIIYPEEVSLVELITLMNRAPAVASYSGSTAHNLLFCRKTRFISIERCAANNIYQAAINKMIGHDATYIDAFYQPMLTSSCDNLTIYGLTDMLKKFLNDNGYTYKADARQNIVKEFRTYLKFYRRHYGYACGLNQWETDQLPAVAEAYFESADRYACVLGGRFPVLWYDFFSPAVCYKFLRHKFFHRD